MKDIIRKTYICETKAVDEELGIYEVMITTEVRDRQRDWVIAAGGKLDNYMKNPVVLFAHDYGKPPVARALELEVMAKKGIRARFQFPPIGTYDFADTVHGLWRGKFLNAASIGFQPGEEMDSVTEVLDEDGEPTGGLQFNVWELLEFSIVPVPANQEALRLALKAVMDDDKEKPSPVHQQKGAAHPSDSNIDDHTELTSEDRKAVYQALSNFFEVIKEAIQ